MPALIIIGGAGTGKTTTLLNTMDKVIERGVDPREIGFVSFTRAARREASERAGSRFDIEPESLEQDGWFKTLHAVCYRQLAVGKELLADSKSDRQWIEQAMGAPLSKLPEMNDEGILEGSSEMEPTEIAMQLWACARNRLVPFTTVHARARGCSENVPSLKSCREWIEKYEQHKRLDGRCDFTDILGRFAGWRFGFDGHAETCPDGEVPNVPVWFLDEAQDNSALTDSVARRLTQNAKWVYLVGDPFQAIYSWAGADPSLFQAWSDRREILPQSYRCPSRILSLGEECLRPCSDYWQRGIAPASDGGRIETLDYRTSWVGDIDPRESWLFLGRTNYIAGRLCGRLNGGCVPWKNTKGGGKWESPKKFKAIKSLMGLQAGSPVTAEEWKCIIQFIPATRYLSRGAKSTWAARESELSDLRPITALSEWGAEPDCLAAIKSGAWKHWIPDAEMFVSAVKRYGWDAVENPNVRVSTIHGAKGMEADNVLIFTATSAQVDRASQERSVADEERRLAYVAVTRARKRLVIARERGRFEMEIPI